MAQETGGAASATPQLAKPQPCIAQQPSGLPLRGASGTSIATLAVVPLCSQLDSPVTLIICNRSSAHFEFLYTADCLACPPSSVRSLAADRSMGLRRLYTGAPVLLGKVMPSFSRGSLGAPKTFIPTQATAIKQ